jgi:flavin reductase (DIM6/NTAB) family NADH-FMN oxidoreductase RutF
MDITQENFKKTLGQFVTGVSVITTLDQDAQPVGITINSLTSLSLEPALILFCIKKESHLIDIIKHHQAFALNILTLDQSDISNMFALNATNKWEKTPFSYHENGLPILDDTQATITCSVYQMLDGGDHMIIIGQVSDLAYNTSKSPLVYFQGQYTHV